MRFKKLIAVIAVLSMALVACTETSGSTTTQAGGGGGSTLAAIQARGTLNCGVNNAVPGFGFVDADGNYSGFDIDFCKALAAAVFGDATKVTYVPLTAQQRFTALQGREIDVLIRNTTFTATRDGSLASTFATTTFYDGQGMMVRTGEFDTIDDMADTTICVLSGTTTEVNLAIRMTGITHTAQTYENNDQLQAAFIAGTCDGWTSDKSQLAAQRSAYPESSGGPAALEILEETFSKEPLGPAVLDGDSQWAQIVNWVVLATIAAEELGVNQGNVGSFGESTNNAIRRLLGLDITTDAGTAPFDPGLGLPTDFARKVVEAVGNYGEIYDRHVGPNTPLGVPRGLNNLWTNGGLLYSPPYS